MPLAVCPYPLLLPPMDPLSPPPHNLLITTRRRDMLLLLENMARREDATIRLILECMYDIGVSHAVQERVRSRRLHGTLRYLTQMSRPLFRMAATRWFHRNCPTLIADWLYGQATFQNLQVNAATEALVVEALAVESALVSSAAPIDNTQVQQALEIARLRRQVRSLKGLLAGSCLVTVGLVAYGTWAGAWVGDDRSLPPPTSQESKL